MCPWTVRADAVFGYVRPVLSLLPQEEKDRYQGAYCGLCHAMGKRHGFSARFTLNYDFAFLAILFSGDADGDWRQKRCPVHPLRKKKCCLCSGGLDAAADASMILTWQKLRDDVLDHGWLRGLPARILTWILGPAYRRARRARPGFAEQVESCLDRLHRMEQSGEPSLDRTADSFACILRASAPPEAQEVRRRVMEQMLYHIGRWIYLVDAWDDLEKDREQERYNPIAARFGPRAKDEIEYMKTTMTHSLRLAVSAANLIEFGQWDYLVQHILHQGLPAVQEAVLAGRWKQQKNKHRETDS